MSLGFKRLMKLGFSRNISKNIPIKFHENMSSGSRIVPRRWMDEQKDRHNLTNSHFSKFCVNAWKLFITFIMAAFC